MNAVFERDFIRFSSSLRFVWMRTVFAAAMGLLLFVQVVGSAGGGTENVGAGVLSISVYLGAALLAITLPGIYATVLVHARTAGSLGVLLSTPLRPLQIAWGAFLSRALILTLFVIATWPAAALALTYGGVRGGQLFEASAAAIATGLLVAAPSFVVSAYARRTSNAVVTSYLIAATFLVVLHFVGTTLATQLGDEWFGGVLSPWQALALATGGSDPAPGSLRAAIAPAYPLLLIAVVLSAISILVSAWRLDREAHGDGADLNAGRLLHPRCRPLRTENPILDHELRRGAVTAQRSTSRGLLGLLILSEIAYFVIAEWTGEPTLLRLHYGVLGFQFALLVLAVTAAGATTLALEHETKVLDLMRVTPLTAAQIVIGKLAGMARGLLPCLLVPVGHLAYASIAQGVFSLAAIPAVMLGGGVVLAAWGVCGMSQSLEQGDPHRAVLRTMGLMGIFGLLTATMVGIPLMSLLGDGDDWLRWSVSFGANPVGALLVPVSLFRTGGQDAENLIAPGPMGTDFASGVVGGLVWLGVYAVIGWVLYRRLFTTYRLRFE